MALIETSISPKHAPTKNGRDVGFAIGIVVILSVLFNHERMRWWQAVGVGATAVGVSLMALGA